MGERIARLTLIGLELFLAAAAIVGAVSVVPTLPKEWLDGSPFSDYTVPALALGVLVGGGACLAAALLVVRPEWGALASVLVGLAMAIFEVVETVVVGLDIWLHALGLSPTVSKGLPGTNLEGVPRLLGVPLPLWQQPLFFGIGIAIVALAMSFGKEAGHVSQHRFAPAPQRH
jgi:hypothetical protein